MDRVGEMPYWELRFDSDGDVDREGEKAVLEGLAREAITDVIVFSHGWNNDVTLARKLYRAFFELFPPLMAQRAVDQRKVGFLGIYWPSRMWSDEPIPDFSAAGEPDLAAGGGSASLARAQTFPPPPPPDEATGEAFAGAFPDADKADVDELLELLRGRPDDEQSLLRAYELLVRLTATPATARVTGGEPEAYAPADVRPAPKRREVIETFQQELETLGVVTSEREGEVAFGLSVSRLWHGMQELARQATYWKMKERAGVVGRRGLGPFLTTLARELPQLRIDLVGHSFGARVVSFALTALPEGDASNVQSVTLLQGAFSQFAFAEQLPHAQARAGALRGMQKRVAGPLVACYSKHDSAVGTFYPLASAPAGDDAAGVLDKLRERFGAIGYDGHKPRPQDAALRLTVKNPGEAYGFPASALVSIDASPVVRHGRPPSGAHSDICHPELAWVVLNAGRLVS